MKYRVFDAEIDLDRVRYDLALTYAKLSLKRGMTEKNIYNKSAPPHILEYDYLLEEFLMAFTNYANTTDEYMIDIICGGEDSADIVESVE